MSLPTETPQNDAESKLANRVIDFIEQSSGWFWTDDINRALNIINNTKDKDTVRRQLNRYADKDLIKRDPNHTGHWRKVETDLVEMDILGAEAAEGMNVHWPFGLEKVFLTIPKSLVLIAGATDAGKTCYLISFMLANQWKHEIHYFSSEMTAGRLKRRLMKFPDFANLSIGFKSYERYDNYADVIKPDAINVIDFLDVDNATPYMIGNELKNIYMKLNTGIAVVAIQKKSAQKDWGGKVHEVELGVGGETTIRRASIYLTMDKYPENKLVIRKAKEWATNINPIGLAWQYKIINGVEFVHVQQPMELIGLLKSKVETTAMQF